MRNNELTKSEYKEYLEKGISYSQYKTQMAEDLASNIDPKIKEYINLNQHRMHRVEKTYKPSEELVAQVKSLKNKIHWLVLTEHWCGDASQSLPVLSALATMSEGKVDLKLVYRDQNDALMNAYLTNGTKSIPKLIQLGENLNITGIWGPRPNIAQKLVKELKANPETAPNYATELHLWYAKDKQHEMENEIAQLVAKANSICLSCAS